MREGAELPDRRDHHVAHRRSLDRAVGDPEHECVDVAALLRELAREQIDRALRLGARQREVARVGAPGRLRGDADEDRDCDPPDQHDTSMGDAPAGEFQHWALLLWSRRRRAPPALTSPAQHASLTNRPRGRRRRHSRHPYVLARDAPYVRRCPAKSVSARSTVVGRTLGERPRGRRICNLSPVAGGLRAGRAHRSTRCRPPDCRRVRGPRSSSRAGAPRPPRRWRGPRSQASSWRPAARGSTCAA